MLTNETINIDLDIYPKTVSRKSEKALPYNHYVALAPGAGGRHKCWPLQNFIALAKDLIQEELAPVFILGPAEEEWKELIESSLPNVECPLQKGDPLSVYLTIALGQRCQVCVCT